MPQSLSPTIVLTSGQYMFVKCAAYHAGGGPANPELSKDALASIEKQEHAAEKQALLAAGQTRAERVLI